MNHVILFCLGTDINLNFMELAMDATPDRIKKNGYTFVTDGEELKNM